MPPRTADELDRLLSEMQQLLRSPEVGAELDERGINASLAMTLAHGLQAYVAGDKEGAVVELATATEEIAARQARRGGVTSS